MMAEVALKYKQVFRENDLDIQIMPLRPDNKNPRYKHKGGCYDDTKVITNSNAWNYQGQRCNMGFLMNEQVFAIDIDGDGIDVEQKKQTASQYWDKLSSEFDLSDAWIEKTKKGYHIMFKKSDSLREITHSTNAFKSIGLPGIDFVTISNSVHDGHPTKSILAVYPSNDKKWMPNHDPFNGKKLGYPPEDLVEWILTNIRRAQPKAPKKTIGKVELKITSKKPAQGTQADVETLKLILQHLPATYYEDTAHGGDWKCWFKVMLGIQHLMGSDGYETWVQFNKRAQCWTPEMQESNLKRYWMPNMGKKFDKPVGIGSFRFWLKTECPESWKEVYELSTHSVIWKAIHTIGDYDIAYAASHILNNVTYDAIKHRWCKFTESGWISSYGRLVVDLNEIVRPEFERIRNELEKPNTDTEGMEKDEKDQVLEEIKRYKNQQKAILTVEAKLSNNSKKIIDLMQSICYTHVEWDNNPWIIGFGSQVFDLKTGVFRPSEITDYVTMKAGCTLSEIEAVTQDDMNELWDIICDILPDEAVRTYQLYLLALALNGIEAKRFCCQNGTGANGKSTLFELIKRAFGDYCKNISTQHYTSPFRESGPRPDLLDLDKTRMFIATEPGEGQRFNTGAIKKITGGDPIRARGLWQGDTIEFSVVGQHNMLCNDKPDLVGIDDGLKRRIINIQYPSVFKSNPDFGKGEKQARPELKTREWAERHSAIFMKLLLDTYMHYAELDQDQYQLDPPKEIMAWTDEWVTESLPMKTWLDDENQYRPATEQDINDGITTEIYFKDLHSDWILRMGNRLTYAEKRTWSRKKCLDTLLSNDKDWNASFRPSSGSGKSYKPARFIVVDMSREDGPDELVI